MEGTGQLFHLKICKLSHLDLRIHGSGSFLFRFLGKSPKECSARVANSQGLRVIHVTEYCLTKALKSSCNPSIKAELNKLAVLSVRSSMFYSKWPL